MPTLTNQETCACPSGGLDPVNWIGVTNGSISLDPTGDSSDDGTWQLVATVPFGTGSTPLVDGLYGMVWLSFSAKSATPGYFGIVKKRFMCGVTGAASASSYTQFLPGTVSGNDLVTELEFYAPDGLSNYVQAISGLDVSGDINIWFVCKETDGHSNPGVIWDISDLKIEYKIIGSV